MVRGSRWFGVEGEATVADGCDSGLAEFDFHLLVMLRRMQLYGFILDQFLGSSDQRR